MRACFRTAVFILPIVAACGNDKKADNPQDEDPRTPVSATVTAAEGGSIALADGSFVLDVPPGAVAEDTTITMRAIEDSDIPGWVADYPRLSGVIEILPDGLVFATPVTATWILSTADLVDGTRMPFVIGGALANDTQSIERESADMVVDGETVTVAVSMEHLSEHAVFKLYDQTPASGLDFEVELSPTSYAVPHTFRPSTMTIHSAGEHAFSATSFGFTPPNQDTVVSHAFGSAGEGDLQISSSFVVSSGLSDTPVPYVPAFTCKKPGEGFARVGVGVLNDEIGARASVVKTITCTVEEAANGREDVVLVGETQRVIDLGSGWIANGGQGVAAKINHMTSDVAAKSTQVTPDTFVYEGVLAFDSVPGPAHFDFTAAEQQFEATRDGNSYAFSGLAAGPIFASGPLVVSSTAVGTDAGWSEQVAPPPAMPVDAIKDKNGLASKVAVPSTLEFDGLMVTASATGSSEEGSAGVSRFVPRSELTEADGELSTPLFADDVIAELTSRGLTLNDIYVGVVNEVPNTTWFDSPYVTYVRAMRSIIVTAAMLEPAPDPGDYTVAQCSALPHNFVEVDGSGRAAVACIGDDDCWLTNDTYTDFPTATPTQCDPPEFRAMSFGFDSGNAYACAGLWQLIWSSTGVQQGYCMFPPLPASQTLTAILAHPSDGRRYEVQYAYSGSTFDIQLLVPYVDAAVPDYGVQYDCATFPRSFPAPVNPMDTHVTICLGAIGPSVTSPGVCTAIGDANATAENESCVTQKVPLKLAYGTFPYAVRGDSTWTITGASHGNHSASSLTAFPEDTDVSVTVSNTVYGVWEIVFRYDNPGFTVISVGQP